MFNFLQKNKKFYFWTKWINRSRINNERPICTRKRWRFVISVYIRMKKLMKLVKKTTIIKRKNWFQFNSNQNCILCLYSPKTQKTFQNSTYVCNTSTTVPIVGRCSASRVQQRRTRDQNHASFTNILCGCMVGRMSCSTTCVAASGAVNSPVIEIEFKCMIIKGLIEIKILF